MLTVGAVHVRRDELARMSYRDGRLVLELRWPLTDLPVLFGVPSATGLQFDHLGDDGEVLPLQVEGWTAEPGREEGAVTARLNMKLVCRPPSR